MPPIRQLAAEHGLSLTLTSEVVKELVSEGVLYTQAGAGTFVGRPTSSQAPLFLMVLPHSPDAATHLMSALSGFEERIAQLGANSISLDRPAAIEWQAQGKMPPLAGVFELSEYRSDPLTIPHGVARVVFGDEAEHDGTVDRVLFDDFDGGCQATRHLLRQGHHNIAFLGLHNLDLSPDTFRWSSNRERGWRAILEAEGHLTTDLAYHPDFRIDETNGGQSAAAALASRELVQRTDITAVVAANKNAAQGMFDALRSYEVEISRWPVVVCFDSIRADDRYSEVQVVTALRLPWDTIGREAADLLWARSRGSERGPGQRRLVQMRLIPRLSCRRNWALHASIDAMS